MKITQAPPGADYLRCDGVDLSSAAVERDPDGIPTAWRLLAIGANELLRNGQPLTIEFSPEDRDEMVRYHREKGVQIPVDCCHTLFQFAQKYGVDEADIQRLLGDRMLACGFGDLAARDDGLWIENVTFNQLGRNMLTEGVLRYFSPALRGYEPGEQLRCTSCTLDNVVALNKQSALAAGGETDPDAIAAYLERTLKRKGGQPMNPIETALAALVGESSISLGAEGDAAAPVIAKIEALARERKAVRTALALGAEVGSDIVEAALKGVTDKAAQSEPLQARISALELTAETGKRDAVIAKAIAARKMDNAMLTWAKTQTAAQLDAWLAHAPVIVPAAMALGGEQDPNRRDNCTALTAEEKTIASNAGISDEEFLAQKKKMLQDQQPGGIA